jgi:hypothetical protein
MPENQSQPNIAGNPANPGGEPRVIPQPDPNGPPDRPSDTEAAHQTDGGAVRDPRLQTDEARAKAADQNHGSLDGHPAKDPRGDAQTGERMGERGNRLDR